MSHQILFDLLAAFTLTTLLEFSITSPDTLLLTLPPALQQSFVALMIESLSVDNITITISPGALLTSNGSFPSSPITIPLLLDGVILMSLCRLIPSHSIAQSQFRPRAVCTRRRRLRWHGHIVVLSDVDADVCFHFDSFLCDSQQACCSLNDTSCTTQPRGSCALGQIYVSALQLCVSRS